MTDDDSASLGETVIAVIETQGHTLCHIGYHPPDAGVIVVGNTMFAMGCGCLFEGTADQKWRTMGRPPETLVCCAHEYTQGNARFATTVEPDDVALPQRIALIDALRSTSPFVHAGSVTEPGRCRLAKDYFK